ncbi:hypothetical protein J8F10_10855 [Gemmata sp. G18]|uniref:Gingipain domain-containing protein n=1 Tax=Gemmata palustris TaxID=2822762 RepID=A0ABS5BQR6_9BACT|nr:C25 family cysteine peptidase [Gemmata palustris]MBP3955782.1 hypothetical protein [Gemmata palustris]
MRRLSTRALLIGFATLGTLSHPLTVARAAAPEPARAGAVVLVGTVPDPDLVALGVMVAAAQPDTDFLLDSGRTESIVKPYFDRLRPAAVTPVGTFPEGLVAAKRWGVAEPVVRPTVADPVAFAWALYPKAERAVVAPRTPAPELLQAACLAGALRVPLFVLREGDDPIKGLKELLAARGTKEITAVGAARDACKKLEGVRVTELADAAATAAAHSKELLRKGKIETLVLANPADAKKHAALAPWVAVKRRAALLLTGTDGKDAGTVVNAALKEKDTARADVLIVVADTNAIPLVKRANPAAGKDEQIDVEPWIPETDDLITLSAGRLFHADRAVVPLLLARPRLLARAPGPPKILIASNPGDGLPLLETFSRNTGRELENAGWKVIGRYGKTELTAKELRETLPEQDAFLWEGHYRTLVDQFEMPKWTEPLRPSLIFLQSCLALNPDESALLFDRGAAAVVGTPNRTYSGSGGALTLAFFDSLAYDGRNAGASMRHAKNFLLCYMDLKAKRLGDGAKMSGANKRAAWTFTIWGDPELKMPKPAPPKDALPALACEVVKDRITLSLPEKRYPPTEVAPYKAEMWPGGRLAGLFTTDEEARLLAPLAFAEVSLPNAKEGYTPRLSSKVPGRNWVFRWDARRRVGYILSVPREKDEGKIEFRVHWDADPVR